MAQISDLTALTNPAAGDMVVVRDISDATDKDKSLVLSYLALLGTAQTFTALQTFAVGARSGSVTIADDAATQIVAGSPRDGILIFTATDSGASNQWGAFAYRGAATRHIANIAVGSNVETALGSAPTGTTGTDGKVTIHIILTGNVYIENRMGGSRTFIYFLIG
jgi:hypothetical protein